MLARVTHYCHLEMTPDMLAPHCLALLVAVLLVTGPRKASVQSEIFKAFGCSRLLK